MKRWMGILTAFAALSIGMSSPGFSQTVGDADFDGDGQVGFSDFLLFVQAFNTTNARFDLSGDGQVGFSDFLYFISFYGQVGTGSISGAIADSKGDLSGVRVVLRGATVDTMVTGADGKYEFTRLFDGAYEVVFEKSWYAFTPEFQRVEIAGGNGVVGVVQASGLSGRVIAAALPGGVPMAFVYIAPGTFLMGSLEHEEGRFSWEGPQHEVAISTGFYLGKYPVTQGQWEAVMGTTPWSGQVNVQAHVTHPAV